MEGEVVEVTGWAYRFQEIHCKCSGGGELVVTSLSSYSQVSPLRSEFELAELAQEPRQGRVTKSLAGISLEVLTVYSIEMREKQSRNLENSLASRSCTENKIRSKRLITASLLHQEFLSAVSASIGCHACYDRRNIISCEQTSFRRSSCTFISSRSLRKVG